MTRATTKERPITFSDLMVRAILDGRKTQTRRVMKPQPGSHWSMPPAALRGGVFSRYGNPRDADGIRCPYGQPGDRLWVKHPCLVIGKSANGFRVDDEGFDDDSTGRFFCWEDFPHKVPREGRRFGRGWPRILSRLTLEVTDVRVERVQDISEEDAHAEGCPADCYFNGEKDQPTTNCTDWFGYLWDSINASRGYSWESNPWVWAITFKRVEDD